MRRGPGEAPRAAEVVRDEVSALDPERVERAAGELGVRLDGLREGRRGRRAESRGVPRDRAPVPSDSRQQRLPVGARARVAVEEDDRLARTRGPGLAQRRADVADAQLRPPHAVGALLPRRRLRPAQHARGDRRAQHARRRLAHPRWRR